VDLYSEAEAEPALTLTVYGKPVPTQNKRPMPVRKGKDRKPTGAFTMVSGARDKGAGERSWRQAIIDEFRARYPGWVPLTGPLALEVTFFLARPASHYGTGRNAGRVRDSAPALPEVAPDWDKLARGLGDALQACGAFGNDAQISTGLVRKRYAAEPFRPGAVIEIRRDVP
jgi:Holliday junction resolvase RusA-like endonuclease